MEDDTRKEALTENQRLITKLEKLPLSTFSIRASKKDDWEKGLANNPDGYGRAIFRYAARWANAMEALLSEGAKLEDIADQSSHDADIEGISGFMYGAAVSMLEDVWEHGEALRRWHNIKT